ncbi:MAG: ABC transporter permease [Chloroflexi bacterium]|nr:ABC transporter permease [Chloroflexota bacterium]
MRKLWIILAHEFRTTLRRPSFIVMTLIVPALAVAGLQGIQWLVKQVNEPVGQERTVGYVDGTGLFTRFTEQPGTLFVAYPSGESARQALVQHEVREYLVIPQDYLATGRVERYTAERSALATSEPEGSKGFPKPIQLILASNLLADRVSPQTVDRVLNPGFLITLWVDEEGRVTSSPGSLAATFLPLIFGVLLAMSIFSSSSFLLQSVAEEKENRVVEVLLSSVSATQLLVGKVLGLGAAGLAQIVIWLLTARLAFSVLSVDPLLFGGMAFPTEMMVLGIIYFLLGYLLFAALLAAVGAATPSLREGTQVAGLFTFPAILPLILATLISLYPDHWAVRLMTFFPLTAPLTALQRAALQALPSWELVLSIAVLAASVIGALVLAAKVFRVGLLMYGKRLGLRELFVAIRQA